jgi:endonuclease/exonuclease/phosphatase family metal-dependent hydrolase
VRFDNHDFSFRGDEKRGILHVVLSASALATVEVHVICVHFGLTEGQRDAQLQLLCELIATTVPQDAPLIVAGDFNDWRLRVHALLETRAGMREVFAMANGATARTFPARCPFLQLDRIYVRNARAHAPIVLPRKPWSHLSDHAPLVAEIQL